MSDTRFSKQALDRLLKPRSVAVVGATDRVGALGATLLSNLVRYEFSGDIYPVNPKRDELMGRRVYATVADLPTGIDCAVLAIPRPAVLATTRALAERGCGAVVIYSAGFSELGEEGIREQRELADIAQQSGMIILGPNCLGCTNYVEGVPLTFVETNMVTPAKGQRAVGIVSQSGALASVLATQIHSRGCYVSRSISTGNEAASGVEDYLDWLIDDESTHVVALYLEVVRRPKAFLAAARRARRAAKPLIVLHPGKSSRARASAATHTGAIAGDHAIMKAKLGREGVIFAESLEELGDITSIALTCCKLPAAGLAVLAESGALRGLAFDLAEEIGLPLLELCDEDSPALRAALPEFVAVSNPLDITAAGLTDPDIYTRTLSALCNDQRVGTVLAAVIQSDPVTCKLKFPPIMKVFEGGAPQKALVFAGVDEGARVPEDYIAGLRRVGIPWFPTTERAYRAIARLVELDRRDLSAGSQQPLVLDNLSAERGVIAEYRAKELLRPLGIRFPRGRFCSTVADAVLAAEEVGFPVVLKAQAAALSHKSEAGGVALNLTSSQEVRAAFARMMASVARYDATIDVEGVLVEAMGKGGAEMIVGAKSDPEWGPVLLAGFGGVAAELLKDVCILTPDMGRDTIVNALMRLKQAAILQGYRGAPALDVEALAQLIALIGRVMTGNPSIRELDLNPVLVHANGGGVTALDAVLVVDDH